MTPDSKESTLWQRDRHTDASAGVQYLARRMTVIMALNLTEDLLVDDRWFRVDAKDLPISFGLCLRVDALWQTFKGLLPRGRTALDCRDRRSDDFIRDGLSVCVALKAELPDWTIVITDGHGVLLPGSTCFCAEVLADGGFAACPIPGLADISSSEARRHSFSSHWLRSQIRRFPQKLCPAFQRKYAGPKPVWWAPIITDEEIMRMEAVFSHREIMVYAEFGTDNLIDFDGDEFNETYLPLSEATRARIRCWRKDLLRFDETQSLNDDPIDWRSFADEGYRLAVALKTELPDWTVHYADRLLFYADPVGGFSPEVLADGRLGQCRLERYRGWKVKDMRPSFIWPLPGQTDQS